MGFVKMDSSTFTAPVATLKTVKQNLDALAVAGSVTPATEQTYIEWVLPYGYDWANVTLKVTPSGGSQVTLPEGVHGGMFATSATAAVAYTLTYGTTLTASGSVYPQGANMQVTPKFVAV